MKDWRPMEQNLFSANHRTKMIANGNGTMAQVYTIEDFENQYKFMNPDYTPVKLNPHFYGNL